MEEQPMQPDMAAEQQEPETPAVDDSRAALVRQWTSKVRQGKKNLEPKFKQMRTNMQYAMHGADKEWIENDNYTVPILNRQINQAVAALYAKNPKVVCEPKKRMMSSVWDGDTQTLQMAMQAMQTGTAGPQQLAILQDAAQTKNQHDMLGRVCSTMEILYDYYMNEQEPNFKLQLKQLVRRTKINGIGYLMIGFQRETEERPDVTAQIDDFRGQLAHVEQLADAYDRGDFDDSDARAEELRSMIEDLQSQQYALMREGLVFEFPRSTEIIHDPRCRQVRGMVGSRWFAREFHMTKDEIEKVYGVNIGTGFKGYVAKGEGEERRYVESDKQDATEEDDDQIACVWEIWDKTTKQRMTVVDGYEDFVEEPHQPVPLLERFWPLFVLTFNECESEKEIIPVSDVEMLIHTQNEYNRSREERRQHRKANRPKYIAAKGRLANEDLDNLESYPSHAVIEIGGLSTGENVANVIQAFNPAPIDPALYETNSEMEDILRTVGAQEANLGGTSGSTATEVSVAESSRTSLLQANVDDLDEFLSEIARTAGQIMLLELDEQTVKEIAGPGAVWPQMDREQIVKEIQLDIKAGSSGQPNRAQELANLERGMPFLLQMPGINPEALATKYAELLELDVDDLVMDGMPSIQALNTIAGKSAEQGPAGGEEAEGGGGGPSQQPRDGQAPPEQQGDQGANNAPSTQQRQQGPQPAYPGGQASFS